MAESIPRVLVCDDEYFFREAIRDVLTGEDLEVIEAVDGETALELASDPAIGVMVLDIRLPGVDGLEVLRRLAVDRPDLHVIMLSANNDQELVLDALRLGACDYLAKPLHDEELVLAVRRAVQAHSVAEGWGRLRSRVDRLAGHLDGLSRGAADRDPGERRERLQDGLVAAICDVLEASQAWVMCVPDGPDPSSAPGLDAYRGFEAAPTGPAAVRWAIERGESLIVADVASDERLAEFGLDEWPDGPFAVTPLRGPDGTLGLLGAAGRAGGGRFASDDLSLLRVLAGHAAALLAVPDLPAESAEPTASPVAPPGLPSAEEAADGDGELARTICDAITNEVAPEQIYQAALRSIEKHLDAAPVSLFLHDPASGCLRCEASCDGGEREDRSELTMGLGLTGGVMQTGRMVATDSPELDARFDRQVDTPLDGVVGPLICVPLSLRGKVVGVFRAYPRTGAEASVRSAEVIAAALSAAVRNALLYRSMLESIDEVADARRAARG